MSWEKNVWENQKFLLKMFQFVMQLKNWWSIAYTVDSRYLDFGYLEQPLISKKKSGPCLNLRSGNKILSIREIAPREQFLLFPQYFQYIFLSKGV